MGKYESTAKMVLEGIGGVENITQVAHCATRLRISYRDKNAIDMGKIGSAPNTAGAVEAAGRQIQIIIGPNVSDAYNDFIAVSGWQGSTEIVDEELGDEDVKKGPKYWLNKLGNFLAPIFMPVIPALVVGGMILAVKNLLVNYCGLSTDSGTAQLMLMIFDAGFSFLPVYIGYSMAKQLNMQPIMGAMLGAALIAPRFAGGTVKDFFGIPIPQVSYGSTVIPIIMGVGFMYYVDKLLKRIIPEALVYFLKPLLTFIVVVPVEFIILGPIGNTLSAYVGEFVLWFGENLGIVALPILSVLYPYMVMLGLDKALTPIGVNLIATVGYNPITLVIGFVSNIAVGASALALAGCSKDAGKKNLIRTFGITGLCGVTEPAFYGALIQQPSALIGTACGAIAGGLFAGIFGLRNFVHGGCPGLMTFLYFVDNNGSLYYVVLAAIAAVITISVAYIATKLIVRKDSGSQVDVKEMPME